MLRTILVPAVAAALLALLTSSRAQAYGACRTTSSSRTSPYSSVQHSGSTTASS